MNKNLFLVTIATFFSFLAYAGDDSSSISAKKEFSNSISFSGTDYYFPGQFRRAGILFLWKDDQVGIYYERKIYHNLRVKLGYNEWNTYDWHDNPGFLWHIKNFNMPFGFIPFYDSVKAGNTAILAKYKMTDFFVSYVFNRFKKHKITVGIGASYTWGLNEVIDSITVYPGYFDALTFTHIEKKYYYGVVPSFSYDYLCLRKRMSIGADVRYREYFNFYLHKVEYGVHLGFNF